MATDATGTPTSPDNIPTYATSGDAPSGKGFNAAMAVIQTALSSRISKPATPATGDALVWNGTTWARASGTPSSSTFLRGDGTWAAQSGSEIVTQVYNTDQTTSSTSMVDLFTFSAATFEATKYYFEIAIPNLRSSIASDATQWRLMEGVTQVGNAVTFETSSAAGVGVSTFYRMAFTPTAASHTYKVQWMTVFAATITIKAVAAQNVGDASFRIVKA